MATTVDTAFEEFLRTKVNLDPDDTGGARRSRDWLLELIAKFPDTYGDFPLLYSERDIAYGSFARRTKIRELDDVDLISCLHATGGTYVDQGFGGPIQITVPASSRLSDFCHDNSASLNSIKVVNRFVKALAAVPQYSSAAINRRGEAAVLELTSYPWSFDVVPGFFTAPDAHDRTYYLIPDGSGHWKRTDPRRDRDRIAKVNQDHDGHVLSIVRLMKYWNRRPTMPSAPSYMFECMITDYYEGRVTKAVKWVDIETGQVLRYIAEAVLGVVNDPKGLQGDLNSLTFEQRWAIRERALLDAGRADEARAHETRKDHERSINKWREVFGPEFPPFE
ncbi:MAG: nucleotidyltransferase [Planctomycetes bacterium]|nr:nucleotidyltransferase [Planctomycetota bacterium]MCW8138285.1 nucleotidyltransferase [Planctomycetota bacterium]